MPVSTKRYEIFKLWIKQPQLSIDEIGNRFNIKKDYSRQLIRHVIRKYYSSLYFQEKPEFVKDFVVGSESGEMWFVNTFNMNWPDIEKNRAKWAVLIDAIEKEQNIDPRKLTPDTRLRFLNIPGRVVNALETNGIRTVGELTNVSVTELLKFPNLGSLGVYDLKELLALSNLTLKNEKKQMSFVGTSVVDDNGSISVNIPFSTKEGKTVEMSGYINSSSFEAGTKIRITIETIHD